MLGKNVLYAAKLEFELNKWKREHTITWTIRFCIEKSIFLKLIFFRAVGDKILKKFWKKVVRSNLKIVSN